jgi:hypothetical protein
LPEASPTPAVSVIVPCHNAAATLPATLASLRAQTCPDWEAICVDDASTDATAALLKAAADADARVRWQTVPHGGLAATRNAALLDARAPWVLFLDADDIARPEALATLLACAADAAVASDTVIAAGYELLAERGTPLGLFRFPNVPQFTVDAFLACNRLPPMTLVPRALLPTLAFDATLLACEDWDLWLGLAARGARCVSVPRVLFGYRLRAGSLTRQTDLLYASGLRVLERWQPHATSPAARTGVPHRWACVCGALAQAAGHGGALRRYWAALPSLAQTTDFAGVAASTIEEAYRAVRGAAGQRWAEHGAAWVAELRPWLTAGPLAPWSADILARLEVGAWDGGQHAERVRAWLADRPDVRRLVLYGLGTNGLTLLEYLRRDGSPNVELAAADDFAPAQRFALAGVPRVNPAQWPRWPAGTAVVVTPDDDAALCAVLVRCGGRAGHDYLSLNAAVAVGSGT